MTTKNTGNRGMDKLGFGGIIQACVKDDLCTSKICIIKENQIGAVWFFFR